MVFPLEKYRFITRTLKDGRRQTIAISTYAGKTVRGTAICAEGDEFDEMTGKQIAATRCAMKIAEKRVARAERKYNEASELVHQANVRKHQMQCYHYDAVKEMNRISGELDKLLSK